MFATALRRRRGSRDSDSDGNSGSSEEDVEAVEEVALEWESGGELEAGRERLLQMLDVYRCARRALVGVRGSWKHMRMRWSVVCRMTHPSSP